MSRRAAALLVAACAAILVAAFWLWRAPLPAPAGAPVEVRAAPEPPAEPPQSFTARLSRPAAGGGLAVEEVALTSAAEPRARAQAALAALLAAPAAGELGVLFPEPVAVHKVLLSAEGTLYVDHRSKEGLSMAAADKTPPAETGSQPVPPKKRELLQDRMERPASVSPSPSHET